MALRMQNHPHQGKNDLFSSRTAFSSERQLCLRGNAEGDSGLVLSTDAKPRLKWTPELHQHFIDAVNQLGGPDKATPKTVMRLMGIPGLTLYHLKSHLQKYRLSKNLHVQSASGMTKNILGCTPSVEQISEVDGSLEATKNTVPEANKALQISEAILRQIEVQRQLNEQLEVQRHLQLRIEAQGKYLQSVLEKTQETLGKQSMISLGLDAAKAQFSELASRVSETHHPQRAQFADYAFESCLTSCEESQKHQETNNLNMRMVACQENPSACGEQTDESMKREMNQHLMNVRNRRPREDSDASSECKRKDIDIDDTYLEQPNGKRPATKEEKGKQSSGYGHPCFKAQLDLNTKGDTDTVPGHKVLDLNGFCWN